MRVAIAGAGKVGLFVARDLHKRGHEIVLIDDDSQLIERLKDKIPVTWVHGDVCEPLTITDADLAQADVMVAATGDDKVNLVASLLAKQEFGIPRVVARVSHPENEWLFNESWGVDVSVSTPHLITSLVEEAVTVGDLVRLLRLEQGKVALVEFRLDEESKAVGRLISELELPRDCTLVAVVRDGHVIAPRGETPLIAGDEVLALSTPEAEGPLEQLLSGRPGGRDGLPG